MSQVIFIVVSGQSVAFRQKHTLQAPLCAQELRFTATDREDGWTSPTYASGARFWKVSMVREAHFKPEEEANSSASRLPRGLKSLAVRVVP